MAVNVKLKENGERVKGTDDLFPHGIVRGMQCEPDELVYLMKYPDFEEHVIDCSCRDKE